VTADTKEKSFVEHIEDYLNNIIKLHEFFALLPDETKREYELYIGEIIKKDKSIDEKAIEILRDTKYNEDILYSAFYCLCIYYRRYKEYRKYSELLTKYRSVFYEHPTFDYLESMFEQEFGDIRKAIDLSLSAIEKVKDNAGILHSHAIILAEAFEDNKLDIRTNPQELDNAIIAAKKAIKLTNNYPKFYCTLGRLQAIKGDFENAKKSIYQAIDMEKPSRLDYSLVIADYQRHITRIEFIRNFKSLDEYKERLEKDLTDIKEKTEKRFSDINESINGYMTRNLEFLGFFTALISFTIGSIQIAANSYGNAARLIITLCGGLLLALGGFGIILNGRKGINRTLLVITLGIIMIVFAMLFPTVLRMFGLTEY